MESLHPGKSAGPHRPRGQDGGAENKQAPNGSVKAEEEAQTGAITLETSERREKGLG